MSLLNAVDMYHNGDHDMPTFFNDVQVMETPRIPHWSSNSSNYTAAVKAVEKMAADKRDAIDSCFRERS